MLKSREISTEASKARLPYAMKEYAMDGKNIPLKKDWSEAWCTLPQNFDNVFDEILNLEVRPADVFVSTYMKCGTSWMLECAWMLMNNLDYENETYISKRSPFIDFHGLVKGADNQVELCNSLPSPRLIKCHLPANLLPIQVWDKKPKIIYVARNVKDVIVSSYHFAKGLSMWLGDNLHDYVNDFLANEIVYTNFWTHIVNFWKMRNESFVFFVTYEEMKRDLAGVVQRLCTFLERPQLTAEEMKCLVKHLSFDKMSEKTDYVLTSALNEPVYHSEEFKFMRRGIIGSFKDELTPELQEKINKWTEECLGQHGVTEEEIFGKL